jgi:hypothetical protein
VPRDFTLFSNIATPISQSASNIRRSLMLCKYCTYDLGIG